MPRDGALERLASKEVLRSEVQKLAVDERRRPPKISPLLTISRDHNCGAEEIARDLARGLGWRLYDRELVDRIAEDRRVGVGVIERLDEQALGDLQEWANQIFLPDYVGQTEYMRSLVHVILDVAREGNAVIVGRGAQFLLPEERRLAVRLVAPLAWRVESYAREFGIDEKEARRVIEVEDERRRSFVEHNFHRDAGDAHHYDLVIDTRSIPRETVKSIILQALRARSG